VWLATGAARAGKAGSETVTGPMVPLPQESAPLASTHPQLKPTMPVMIYTRDYCFYCESAKDLLRRKGVVFTEINMTGDPARRAEMIERAGGRSTVPQIFIGTMHVGGCDELFALDAAGRLDPLLADKGDDAS